MAMTTSITPPHAPISDAALDQIFRTARTCPAWLDTPVSDETLRQILS